jgi:hypothetical protein
MSGGHLWKSRILAMARPQQKGFGFNLRSIMVERGDLPRIRTAEPSGEPMAVSQSLRISMSQLSRSPVTPLPASKSLP